MAARTYLPTLIWIVIRICKYVTIHDAKIRLALADSGPALSAYSALKVACDGFRVATEIFVD